MFKNIEETPVISDVTKDKMKEITDTFRDESGKTFVVPRGISVNYQGSINRAEKKGYSRHSWIEVKEKDNLFDVCLTNLPFDIAKQIINFVKALI